MLISSGRFEICIDCQLKQVDFITWTLLLPPAGSIRIFTSNLRHLSSHLPTSPLFTMPANVAARSSTPSLVTPCSQNLITAWLANLELIHFRWRWLITAERRVTSVTRQHISQWIKALMLTVQTSSWQWETTAVKIQHSHYFDVKNAHTCFLML